MKKVVANFAIFAALAVSILSCGIPTSIPTLPSEVVVKASPSISVPLGSTHYSLMDYLPFDPEDPTKDHEGDYYTIYDYQPGGGDSAQRFLFHYHLDTGEGVDLDEIRTELDSIGEDNEFDVDFEYDVPSLPLVDDDGVAITAIHPLPTGQSSHLAVIKSEIDITNVIDTIDKAGKVYIPSLSGYLPFPLGKTDNTTPNSGSIEGILNPTPGNGITLSGLGSVTFKKGMSFNLTFALDSTDLPSSTTFDNATLTFSEVKLVDASSPSKTIAYNNTSVILSRTTPSNTLNPLKLEWDGDSNSTQTFPKDLKLQGKFSVNTGAAAGTPLTGQNFQVRITTGFEGLEYLVGVENVTADDDDVGDIELNESIDLSGMSGDNKFISATVGADGKLTLDFDAILPGNKGTVTINRDAVKIEQAPLVVGGTVPGVGIDPGVHNDFEKRGLKLVGKITADYTADYMEIGSKDTPLVGQYLNCSVIEITGTIKLKIPASPNNKITFSGITVSKDTSSSPVKYIINRNIPVDVDIPRFDFITVQLDDATFAGLKRDPETFAMPDVTDLVNYVSIKAGKPSTDTDATNDGVGVWLDYTYYDEVKDKHGTLQGLGGMEMVVTATDFEIDPADPGKALYARQTLDNTKVIKFTNNDSFDFYPPSGDLEIAIDLVPKGKGYIDKAPGKNLLALEGIDTGKPIAIHAKAKPIFGWDYVSAKIPEDMKDVTTGRYPKIDEDDPFVYVDRAKNYKGLGFDTINARLYINAPESIQPAFKSLKAFLDEGKTNPPDLYTGKEFSLYDTVKNGAVKVSTTPFVLDPAKQRPPSGDSDLFIFTGDFPANGNPIDLTDLTNWVMKGENEQLHLEYEVTMLDKETGKEGVVITHEYLYTPDPNIRGKYLNNVLKPDINILVDLPMKFKRLENDGTPLRIFVEDIDLGDKDIFGREDKYDESYFEYVTSLEFNIDMKNLAGLKAGKIILVNQPPGQAQPDEILLFDLSKQHMQAKPDMEILKKYPFVPKLVIEFPKETENLRFDRGLSIDVQSVTVKAEAEYTLETGF